MKQELIKNDRAGELIQTILIWGVVSVLSMRIYLKVMNNPMVEFGKWHIAHMLWGGLFMIIAMLLVLAFEGFKIKKIGAVIFGIGWGLFIDEVGKFLTKNNDYWFRPAIIFIYISFIGLFLFYRFLERTKAKGDIARFYGVLNSLEEVVINDLEIKEKKVLQKNLSQIASTTDNSNLRALALGISGAVVKIKPISDRNKNGVGVLIRNVFKVSYNRFFRRRIVMYSLWIYSIYYACDKIIDTLRITASGQKMMMIERFYEDYDFFGKSDIYMIVFKIIFDVAAAVLFLLGARFFWSKKRNKGIRYFRYGLYISIFFVSIFRFYFEQFGAMYELIVSIVLLELLNQYQKETASK